MKLLEILLILCVSAIFSGCAYSYRIGVSEDAALTDVATVVFSNRIKMAEIDGKEFKPKYSPWVDGWHTVYLPAGPHSFTFLYNGVGGYGGYYTQDFSSLYGYLDPGKKYEISYEITGSRIMFMIKDIEHSGSMKAQADSTMSVQY